MPAPRPSFPTTSELAVANAAIEESFPAAAGVELIQIVAQGDILAPESPLQAISDLQAGIIRDPEAAAADFGSLDVSLFSVAKAGADSEDSRTSSTLLLMILAMAVIIILLAIFYRTGWDVILTVNGLFITIAWTFGALAWLSPGGAGIIEPENNLIPLVPVLLIGLCVDYALQVTGRYRENLRLGGVPDD